MVPHGTGEKIRARASGAEGLSCGLEVLNSVEDVEAGLELGCGTPSAELAFDAVVDADFDLTAIDVVLANVDLSCGWTAGRG